jgi:hypothetical protein
VFSFPCIEEVSMLALLTRRRPAAPSLYRRRPALERLEDRNSPSALDPTLSLTAPDLSTSSAQSIAAPVLPSSPAVGSATPSPAPLTGSFLAAVVAPAPAPTAPAGTTTGTSGSTPASSSPLLPLPVIDGCAGAENADLTVTVSGHVTDTNPTSLTVTFSGWVMDGLHTSVDTSGNFTVTFNVPNCTSASTANHTCAAVAADGAGRASAAFGFIVEQTPT